MKRPDRRSVLGFSLGSAGAMLSAPALAAGAASPSPAYRTAEDRWIIDDTSAVADTESGKVMGYVRGGIRIFKGIPYAEALTPQVRWVRGAKVRPWTGKRSCRAAGPACPGMSLAPGDDEVALRDCDLNLTRFAEDCLRLNVWTPGVDNKKRQVLFYCHGGALIAGSGIMSARYEGHNLARYGDVVVVSVNHRLNAFGFLDLTAYGERWAESANLGMLDIVDALKWVQANIANFGGDPDKVMIVGHSGGGAKVLTLLSMPEAKGLFSRAVAHSPGPWPFSTPQESGALTSAFLKLVNVSPNAIDALNKLPVETLLSAAITLQTSDVQAREMYDKRSTAANNGWRPVVDGRTVLYQPASPTVPSEVPLLIGTTLHEHYFALGHPEYALMREPEARQVNRLFFGPVGDGVYDIYKGLHPEATPFEVSAMSRAMGWVRSYCVRAAQRRAAFNAAPTYNYWFQWRADTFEGRAMSHHEIEMGLVFLNSDAIPAVTGGMASARTLSRKMVDAWLAFARTGNPNTKALPHWNPVTPTALSSMVLNDSFRIDHGSDMAAIDMFWKDRYPAG